MGVKHFNVANLGSVGLLDPEQMGYQDSVEVIKDESFKIQKSFVKIGWYLKHIRDNQLYAEDGYANIYECAADQFGYSQSSVSRFINICEKFSKDQNSPELDTRYAGFDKSQMIEMLPLNPDELEKVTPEMTVSQIREIKSDRKTKSSELQPEEANIPGQTSIEKDFSEYMPTSAILHPTYPEGMEDVHNEVENPDKAEVASEDIKEQSNANEKQELFSSLQSDGSSDQPDFPVLKNNDQRKEWLANYKVWGLWYTDDHIDVNYYKFDFLDGSRLVVAEYPQRYNYWDGKKKDECFYHLLEKSKKCYHGTYDEKYRHSTDSETYLVEFLKNLQKKG